MSGREWLVKGTLKKQKASKLSILDIRGKRCEKEFVQREGVSENVKSFLLFESSPRLTPNGYVPQEVLQLI